MPFVIHINPDRTVEIDFLPKPGSSEGLHWVSKVAKDLGVPRRRVYRAIDRGRVRPTTTIDGINYYSDECVLSISRELLQPREP